ncbi:uncharacterized protein LOC125083831 isoform X3 [Lutra lutra]|uniref:uncharacterized protein LOC125083831 isoform X3 n=1 Tax=Lutra lutra TaxID=9657 RepID=UPI001FD4888E|nr:uncharacterized protein LOC125083831 isoform X3 [Lutra lutra]
MAPPGGPERGGARIVGGDPKTGQDVGMEGRSLAAGRGQSWARRRERESWAAVETELRAWWAEPDGAGRGLRRADPALRSHSSSRFPSERPADSPPPTLSARRRFFSATVAAVHRRADIAAPETAKSDPNRDLGMPVEAGAEAFS